MSDPTQAAVVGVSAARPGSAVIAGRAHADLGRGVDRGRPAASSWPAPPGDTPGGRAEGSVRAGGTHQVTLAFEGAFDALAVARAQAALVALPEQDRLILDISKVSDVDWCALASLAAKLVGVAPHRVLLTGYCEQHARLLAYLHFGALLEPEPPGPRALARR